MNLPERYVVSPDAPKPSQLLRQALILLGPNGEHWGKRSFRRVNKRWFGLVRNTVYCAAGAIKEVNTDNETAATIYLAMATSSGYVHESLIYHFNDQDGRTFAEVKAKFEEAIKLAEADGN